MRCQSIARLQFAILALISLLLLGSAGGVRSAEPAPESPDPVAVRKLWSPYFEPIPKPTPADSGGVLSPLEALGERLFYERALSPKGNRSCNDCHDLSRYGTNGDAAIELRARGSLRRDVPSVFNIAGLNQFGWAASEKDLRARTAAALISDEESGMRDTESVVSALRAIPVYQARFATAYHHRDEGKEVGVRDNPITFPRVVEALSEFQSTLITRAPFDDFLLGDDQALNAEQLRGAILFDQKNCSACHTGSAIGGQMIQKAGIVVPWPNQDDLGHFEVSGNPGHKLGFRVPPLRNVAETAPYFHDHSARSLRRAIRDIALREQGIGLDFEEIKLIEAFLRSFTGVLPDEYTRASTGKEEARDSGHAD